MLILFAIFVLLLSVKLTASFNWGCIPIAVYMSIFAIFIFREIFDFRKSIQRLSCKFCLPNTFCEKLCKSNTIYSIFKIILAIIISISLIAFLISIDIIYFIAIFFDIFIIKWLYFSWQSNSAQKQVVEEATIIYSNFVVNVLNSVLLILIFIILELLKFEAVNMSPDIFYQINEKIKHSCQVFQHILRTQEFLNKSVYAIKEIEYIGNYLFAFFYISTLSLFPVTAITFLYKQGLKLNEKLKK